MVAPNSDELSRTTSAGNPDVLQTILPVCLTDGEAEGLFGFSFD
ncbi:hypothetical protein [Methylobacterium sp. J-070]|nr:hypothetical protein [Methylobacterium sp. J-070]